MDFGGRNFKWLKRWEIQVRFFGYSPSAGFQRTGRVQTAALRRQDGALDLALGDLCLS
jgi:hypothetical protein